MERHLRRAQLAESLGFSAIWLRDVPFNVPSFGDAGQTFDPFVYLGLLAGATETIALGVASIILPLRHPAHVAKAAASVDVLSSGRLILGVASGDRPEEYPALNLSFESRGERFRESFEYIKHVLQHNPSGDLANGYGFVQRSGGIDLLPKPEAGRIPMLITGGSQQSPQWLAQNGDGWMTYPRPIDMQSQIIERWRNQVAQSGRPVQPVLQPLHIDLVDDPKSAPKPIHLGFRSGSEPLIQYLKALRQIGVNHVGINLRFNQADIETTMHRLAEEIIPAL